MKSRLFKGRVRGSLEWNAHQVSVSLFGCSVIMIITIIIIIINYIIIMIIIAVV